MKRCPRCEGQLAGVQVGAVNVDGCGGCGGVWFDNQELCTIAKTDAHDLLALEDRFLPGPSGPLKTRGLQCPNCQVALNEFSFPHVPNVRLDGCPSCKGVWADEGELVALYSATHPSTGENIASDPRCTARQAMDVLTVRRCASCGTVNKASNLLCCGCSTKLDRHEEGLCPNCDTILTHRNFGTTTLEVCCGCTGVWLDAGELSLLANVHPDALQHFQDDADKHRAVSSAMWRPIPKLLCPRCCVRLAEQEHVQANGERLDTCDKCNGIWVGAGQLDSFSRHYTAALTRRSLA